MHERMIFIENNQEKKWDPFHTKKKKLKKAYDKKEEKQNENDDEIYFGHFDFSKK